VVNTVAKSKAPWYIKVVLWFVPTNYWITIKDTVYYPDWYPNFDKVDPKDRLDIIEHEEVHPPQWKRYGTFGYIFLYLFIPFPIFFAYFRWKFEREAYLVNIVRGDWTIEEVVDALWGGYLWTWPKPLMRRWFKKHTM
jgi:hypothetical protein